MTAASKGCQTWNNRCLSVADHARLDALLIIDALNFVYNVQRCLRSTWFSDTTNFRSWQLINVLQGMAAISPPFPLNHFPVSRSGTYPQSILDEGDSILFWHLCLVSLPEEGPCQMVAKPWKGKDDCNWCKQTRQWQGKCLGFGDAPSSDASQYFITNIYVWRRFIFCKEEGGLSLSMWALMLCMMSGSLSLPLNAFHETLELQGRVTCGHVSISVVSANHSYRPQEGLVILQSSHYQRVPERVKSAARTWFIMTSKYPVDHWTYIIDLALLHELFLTALLRHQHLGW